MSFFCGHVLGTSLCQQQGRASAVTSIREMGILQEQGLLPNASTEQQHIWGAETAQHSTVSALKRTPRRPFQSSSPTVFTPPWKPVIHVTVYNVPQNTQNKRQILLQYHPYFPRQHFCWFPRNLPKTESEQKPRPWLCFCGPCILWSDHISDSRKCKKNSCLPLLQQLASNRPSSLLHRAHNIVLFRLPLWKPIIFLFSVTHLSHTRYLSHSPHSFSVFFILCSRGAFHGHLCHLVRFLWLKWASGNSDGVKGISLHVLWQHAWLLILRIGPHGQVWTTVTSAREKPAQQLVTHR